MKDGTDAFTAREYDKSARLFLQVGMADPDNIDAWLAYAIARFASGDYGMSADAIRRGVGRYPDVVNSPFDLRERYGNPDDFSKHLTALREFVLDNNGNADGWVVLGFVRHFAGERRQAARTFETVKQRFESDDGLADIFLKAKSPGDQSATPPAETSPSSTQAPPPTPTDEDDAPDSP